MTNFSSKEARFEKLLRDARLFSEGRAFFSFPSDAAISRDASGIPPLSKRASAPPGNSKLPSESIRRALVWLYAQGASIPSEPLLWRVPWLAILPRERARDAFASQRMLQKSELQILRGSHLRRRRFDFLAPSTPGPYLIRKQSYVIIHWKLKRRGATNLFAGGFPRVAYYKSIERRPKWRRI